MALSDAERLLQALKVEVQHNYSDLQGRTARFSEFVVTQLDELIPKAPPGEGRARFQRLKQEFADYRALDLFDRADLISRLRAAIPLLRATAARPGPDFHLDAGRPSPERRPSGRPSPERQGAEGVSVEGPSPQQASGERQSENWRPPEFPPSDRAAMEHRSEVRPSSQQASGRRRTVERTPEGRPQEALGSGRKGDSEADGVNSGSGGGSAYGAGADPLLGAPVSRLRGVGPWLLAALERMGISTVGRLLEHYPRNHLDFATRTRIRDLQEGRPVTIWGTIRRCEAFTPPRRPTLSINSVWISDGTGTTAGQWFLGASSRAQQEAWKRRFPVGHQILLSGVPKRDRRTGQMVFAKPEVEVLGPGEDEEDRESLHVGRVVPIYKLTEGLGQKALRRVVHEALEAVRGRLHDPLQPAIRSRYGLAGREQALRDIHFPATLAARDAARRRLVFEELFWLQLGLAFKRAQLGEGGDALVLEPRPGGLVDRLIASLPFELTRAQKRVFGEIDADLRRPAPMNRLVQGDVGSGKTVVALLALLRAIENGYQGALMAPTEILAEQHYHTFKKLLAPLKVEVALLLGKQPKKHRDVYLDALATGFCKIAVGTHALIQEGVRFQNLGLVVIDEQHRFGVRQRKLLRDKGLSGRESGPQVEVLTMTATPIPRTLAMSLYGDLDVSAIDELPPGRKPVTTRWLKGKGGRKQAWDLVKREVAAGRQAYVVFPLVEESEKLDLKSATQEYERLGTAELAGLRLGLLHGQMPPDEKEAVVAAFRARDLDVLVATTVVEVGVDVPNATVMVIENAERFGLSQLHQLRGRVGRGAAESFCILLADSDSEGARERMEVMCATHDGFVIAQKDLELRGPGEFIGTRQSGIPDLMLANLATDADILEQAREAAFEIVAADPTLARNPELKAGMVRAYQQNLSFLGIG